MDAGDFSSWLASTRQSENSEQGAEVPCGDCRTCCTSSYFIHLAPTDTDALAHISTELLFPAPGLPSGHMLLGYNEQGHCPMLTARGCSIYAYRPHTCRVYDCRVFAATGLVPAERDKGGIARQAQRWEFSIASETGKRELAAVRAAAAFLCDHADQFPEGYIPTNSTQLAVLAVKIYRVFLAEEKLPVAEKVKLALATLVI